MRNRLLRAARPRRAAFSAAGRLLFAAFNPPTAVCVLAAPTIAALMTWVFILGNEQSPLSYAAYALSAYLLAVLVIRLARMELRRGVRSLANRNALIKRLLDDASFRRLVAVLAGFALDVLWAAANLVAAAVLQSAWLVTLGVYYLLFGLMRAVVFVGLRKRRTLASKHVALMERFCGVALLLSAFVLTGIVCLTLTGDGTFAYEGVFIYAVAAYAFYALVVSLVNYAKLRKHGDALVVANCRINLSVAVVSMFALETAMLAAFGSDGDAALRLVMPAVSGAVAFALLIGMGVRSIADAGKVLRADS